MKNTNSNPNKISKEELQEKINKSLEQIKEENASSSQTNQQEDLKTQEKKNEEVKKEEEKKEIEAKETKKEVDYKKKFIESSREALILHARNKQMREAIEKAIQLPEPTDEEMAKMYDDWDLMTDTERRIVKDNYLSKQRLDALYKVITAGKDIEEWVEKVEEFATDPKVLNQYPELEGKTDEFVEFASKPTRRGVPFEDLVAAFLYHKETTKQVNKGKMFETGTAGSNEKPAPTGGKISLEEAEVLRRTDYKKYKELLLAGKIQTDIE